MVESLSTIVAAAKKSKYSLVKHLSEDDILAVWDSLADFIERQMLQVKGVCIHGFGTFTFSQRKVDMGVGKVLLIQRPVFVMAENFIQIHLLTYPRQHATGQIPVVALNYTVLCNGTSYDRDTVELSIREILQAIAKALASNKSINIDFPKIGRLVIREKRAHMKFFKEFVRSIESSGNPQVSFHPSTYNNGSESSVISEPNDVVTVRAPQLLPKITEKNEDDNSTNDDSDNTLSEESVELPQPSLQKNTERPDTPYHSPRPATVVPLSVISTASSNTSCQGSGETSAQASTCSHNNGKSLCYVCHQRELRNIPVSLTEERKKRELLQDKLLQKFQERKNFLFAAQEKARQSKNREVAQEIAEFNYEVSEKKRRGKQNPPKSFDYDPSCVFSYRSTTPCYTKKQREYCHQLDQQVRKRREAMEALKQEEEKCEKLEQMELSKELALIREAFATKMAQRKASYQQALDEQIRLRNHLNMHDKNYKMFGYLSSIINEDPRPCLLPLSYNIQQSNVPGSMVHSKSMKCQSPVSQPVFCVQENVPTRSDQQERARVLFQEQLAAVAEKQKAKKIENIRERENDALLLSENLRDLKHDLKVFNEEYCSARKELEESWKAAIRRKQLKDLSEKLAEQASSVLLHDQCKRYLRCNQCQRKVTNLGKSNVLSESRYIAGSRLIV